MIRFWFLLDLLSLLLYMLLLLLLLSFQILLLSFSQARDIERLIIILILLLLLFCIFYFNGLIFIKLLGSLLFRSCINWNFQDALKVLDSFCKDLILGQLPVLNYVLNFLIGETQQNIFWFQVCVYDTTNSMQEVQTNQTLFCDSSAYIHGHLKER